MPIYLYLQGINGPIVAKKYQGWIEVQSVGWGGGRKIEPAKGRSKNREFGTLHLDEIQISKKWDKASAQISSAYFQAKAFPGLTTRITWTRTGDTGGLYVVRTITLMDVLMTSYETGGKTEQEYEERLSLSYIQIEFSDYTAPEVNQTGVPARFGYDLSVPGPI